MSLLAQSRRDAPCDEVRDKEQRRGRRQRLQGDEALAEAGAGAVGGSQVRLRYRLRYSVPLCVTHKNHVPQINFFIFYVFLF